MKPDAATFHSRGVAIGKVQEWLDSLDLVIRQVDHPDPQTITRFVVASTAKRHPGHLELNVDFPSRAPVVIVFGQTTISPEHVAKWVNADANVQGQFLHDYWETCARGRYGPILHLQMQPPHLWGVLEEIYFDGLTRDRFFQGLRGVAATTHYLILHFLQVLGIMPPTNNPTGNLPEPANATKVEWDDPKEESK